MTAAWVAALAAVATVILMARPLRWAFRLLIATHEFLADWPRMKTAISELRGEVAEIKAETRPNGGHSMRDIVHRTAEDVAQIKSEQAAVRVRLEVFDAARGENKKGALWPYSRHKAWT